MNGDYVALAGRMREALSDLERVVARTEMLRDKALRTGDDGYWDGVALNLHGYYAGVERIFEDISRTMEQNPPSGPDWHQDLLLQMSAAVTGVRPPVINRETRHRLDEYRAFRHVVRNVYAFNLRPSRLQELADGVRGCLKVVRDDLSTFAGFLESLPLSTEGGAED